MAKETPFNSPKHEPLFIDKSSFNKNSYSNSDKVSVKDSAVYKFRQWNYLIKRQVTNNKDNELLILLDELSKQGWELVRQPVNLGFYIFKKPAK